MQSVLLTTAPRQTFDTVLDGQTVTMTVWWQPLDGSWYLSVTDATGAKVASGRRMAVGVRLIRAAGFTGDLAVASNQAGNTDEVGREGWGDSHTLFYLTAAETSQVEWVA